MLHFRHPDKPIETSREVVADLDASGDWLGQYKYDGYRTEIYFSDNKIELFTRVGNPLQKVVKVPQQISGDFCTMQKNINNQPIPVHLYDSYSASLDVNPVLFNGAVLDGEFVGPRGSLSPHLYLFDVLALGGCWLTRVAFSSRWNVLKNLCDNYLDSEYISLAETFENGFLSRFEMLKMDWAQSGADISLYEGIVLKRKSGDLNLGITSSAASNHMYKLKYRDIRRPV